MKQCPRTTRRPRVACEWPALLLIVVLLAACSSAPVRKVDAGGGHDGHYALALAATREAVAVSQLVATRTADATAGPGDAAGGSVTSAGALPAIDRDRLGGTVVKHGPRDSHRVAITLDDGPSANTAEVLRVLRKARARATFFFVGGRAEGRRQVVETAAAQGFEVEDHTWSHEDLRGRDHERVLGEIARTQDALARDTGRRPVFFRPKGGRYDAAMLEAVREHHLVMALWSLHGLDTGPGTHAATIAHNVVRSARGGDIILLHETNPETVAALPEIIAGLRHKGLEPVTLAALLAD